MSLRVLMRISTNFSNSLVGILMMRRIAARVLIAI